MLQSFYTAFTGLVADKDWLSVISDNIANVNTVGFKAERAVFEDILATSMTTFRNSSPVNLEIGGGTFIGSTQKDFTQGAFMSTGNPLDLALDGEGFFMVKDNFGTVFYTRNGEFRLDANGDLINALGMKVQGWMLDENGNMTGSLTSINIPMNMAPSATTQVRFKEPTNLDANSVFIEDNPDTTDKNEAVFDPSNSITFNYVSSMTIYDSLGNEHELKFYFVHKKDALNQPYWLIFPSVDGKPIGIQKGTNKYAFLKITFNTDGSLNLNSIKAVGKISSVSSTTISEESGDHGTFRIDLHNSNYRLLPGSVRVTYNGKTFIDDGVGNLIDETTGEVVGSITYTDTQNGDEAVIYIIEAAQNGSSDSITVSYDYYDESTESTNIDYREINTGIISFGNGSEQLSFNIRLDEIKQYASDFIFYAQQDGNSKGDLVSVSVSEDGVIRATYSNGKIKGIARLAVATFKDKEMLVRKGTWLFFPNLQTYTAIIVPGGIISKVRSGMLEMSNVDIANEFINLISAQRSYQANARVITTDDQVLQETMNIKR